jgi:hypothetical protein
MRANLEETPKEMKKETSKSKESKNSNKKNKIY